MERGSDRFASPPAADPLDGGDFDDDFGRPPGSDGFSSCEESDLERYCSANSALGTPSLCSSVGHHAELLLLPPHLDSFLSNGRNQHPADDASADNPADNLRTNRPLRLDSLSCDGGLDCPSPRHLAPFDYDRMRSLPRIRTGSALTISRPNREDPSPSARPDDQKADSDEVGVPSVPARGEETIHFVENSGLSSLGSASAYQFPSGNASGEADDGASSRCEHSEGEDSMFGYGTEDEGQRGIRQCNKWRGSEHAQGIVSGNDHPLFLNSSVAFGSDDWDDFMQETGEHGLAAPSLFEGQPAQQQLQPSKSNGNPQSSEKNHGADPFPDIVNQEGHERGIPAGSYQSQASILSSQIGRTNIVRNPLSDYEDSSSGKPLSGEYFAEGQANVRDDGPRTEISSMCSEEVPAIDAGGASENRVFGESAPCSTSTGLLSISSSDGALQSNEGWSQEADKASPSVQIMNNVLDSGVHILLEGNSDLTAVVEEDLGPNKVTKLDTNYSYDEMVLEMEEILLDSGESHGPNFALANIPQRSHHFRDGSSTASTSGTDEAYPLHQLTSKIDWVEVVGAKQKKGDVSFGERLVGVREYTVYTLRVCSCKDQWEVERRYRDFFTLYRQLRTLFKDYGLTLPSPWSNVERESRKLFGNASPTVVSDRSTLIQECLQSILNSRYPFGAPSPLVFFLSPGKGVYNSDMLKSLVPKSLQKVGEDWSSASSNSRENCPEDFSSLGKTISLVVEMKPYKSMRQLLESQHYRCAGCHMHLEAGKTLLRELVQTFGWNKPRFCEYTGQLFCASCHTNDSAVLPARVLHHWDFSLYPVSQLARAYLESIYDQPMICVSAVNPFLFSKVPALLHVMGIRKKIGAMLPYVRCPFRGSIQRGLGFRRYLLEGNDFFALRDLVDLSKGAFAALPVMVENVSNKIFEHITEQCLVCYDTGVPCAARGACDDPSSLIFPFQQEAEAAKCGLCGSIFHKPCFAKLKGCPCGKPASGNERVTPTGQVVAGAGKSLDRVSDGHVQPSNSDSTSGFFSNILYKVKPEKIWKPKNSSPVILMGSLPSTSL